MPVTKPQGFTLIELVVGIVVFSIALVLFTTLVVPQAKRSVEPIFQVRAAELGQSLISEITSRSFDEYSDRRGGAARCNELDSFGVFQACTSSVNFGPEEASRDNYDDIDDYHGLIAANAAIKNALNEDITLDNNVIYNGFSVNITVMYDDNMNGLDDDIETGGSYTGNTKLITVIVTTPNNEDLIFSSYRSNF